MKIKALSFVFSLFLSLILGKLLIPILKRVKCGQPILKYVEAHKDKSGTPTMGGLFFISASVISYFIFFGFSHKLSIVCLAIGIAYMIVGFLDDFIKIKLKRNEGLKAYQKIVFQLAIAGFAGYFCFANKITEFFLPFTNNIVDLKWGTIPFVAFIFLAITNSVNLTDGLDGLAGSVSAMYLMVLIVLIWLEISVFGLNSYLSAEYEGLINLCIVLVGAISGFLVFNQNKAKVFMGDTGSLSLGGFIGAISIFSSNSFFIPIIGITFVASSISVIVQVVYFKLTSKRVFLMAPLHHHFQMKGYSESKITYCYFLTTLFFGVISVIALL